MNPIRHSRQAVRILRNVGDVPGVQEVAVVTRTLTHATRPPALTTPRQEVRTFPAEQAPGEEVPAADDIIITLRGELPRGEEVSRVVTRARSLLSRVGAQWEWDVRSQVQDAPGSGGREYQISLFTDAPPGGDTKHYA
jgi:hypothetical protein